MFTEDGIYFILFLPDRGFFVKPFRVLVPLFEPVLTRPLSPIYLLFFQQVIKLEFELVDLVKVSIVNITISILEAALQINILSFLLEFRGLPPKSLLFGAIIKVSHQRG